MTERSGVNIFTCTDNSRHHTNSDNDLVKLINTSNIIRNLTNNDFTISNNQTKTGISSNSGGGGFSSGVHISLCGGNSHPGSVIQGNANLHGSVGSVIQGSSSHLHTTDVVYSNGGRRAGCKAGSNSGVFCLRPTSSTPPGLHLITSVGDLSAHFPGRVVQRQQPNTAPDDEDELGEDEEDEEGEENDEEECVQQAFPTDLSLNARDKNS